MQSFMTGFFASAFLLGMFAQASSSDRQPMSYKSPPDLPSRFTPTKQIPGKPELTLGTFVNYGGHILAMGPNCYAGLELAMDSVQKASLLSDYELVLDAFDDYMGERGDVTKMTIGYLDSASKDASKNIVPLLVATLCSESVFIGQFLKYYNYVGMAEVTIVLDHYTERRRYEDFYVLLPSFETFYESIPPFIQSNGWTRVFLLTETFLFWGPYEELLQYHMNRANISLAGTSKVITVTDGLPAPEHFEGAVRELASLDPRIIIVNTHFGGIVACWLHRYGLYGPSYVYIFFGPAFFLPNTMVRAANCTDQIIFETLQSVIFFKYGGPHALDPETAIDAVGTTGTFYDNQLKTKIDLPELNEKWFYWRSYCYTQVVAAALILNRTETKLKQRNDTLLNWVAKSDNFQRNGSYIQSIIREELAHFHYKGLNTYEDAEINGRTGITGFFQVQLDEMVNIKSAEDFLVALKVVPIARYNSARKDGNITRGPSRLVWRTPDGHTPYDSMRITLLLEPTVKEGARGILFGLAAAVLCFNVALLVVNHVRIRSEGIARSLPLLNTLVLFGNIFTLCFIFILPMEGGKSAHAKCIAASFVLVLGFSIISGSIMAKMQIAAIVVSQEMSARHHANKTTRPTAFSILTPTQLRTSQEPHVSVATSTGAIMFHVSYPRLVRRAIFTVLLWALIQVLLLAIWFGLEPPGTEQVNRILEPSTNDLSLSYQHFTYACHVDIAAPLSQGFLLTLLVCYLIVALRSLYLAFLLRKASFDNINDLHLIRIASYTEALSVVAGGAVIGAFFSADFEALEISVSALTMIIVFINSVLIFAPKLRRGYFF